MLVGAYGLNGGISEKLSCGKGICVSQSDVPLISFFGLKDFSFQILLTLFVVWSFFGVNLADFDSRWFFPINILVSFPGTNSSPEFGI